MTCSEFFAYGINLAFPENEFYMRKFLMFVFD